jgi:hypothetical protein
MKNYMKEQTIIYAMADKGGGVVLLKEQDYINKVNIFLTENEYIKLKHNPNESFNRKVDAILKTTEETLQYYNTNKRKLLPMNINSPNKDTQTKPSNKTNSCIYKHSHITNWEISPQYYNNKHGF